VFRIRARDLRAARGRVRCGTCAHRFDAIVELRDEDEDDPRPTLTEIVDRESAASAPPYPLGEVAAAGSIGVESSAVEAAAPDERIEPATPAAIDAAAPGERMASVDISAEPLQPPTPTEPADETQFALPLPDRNAPAPVHDDLPPPEIAADTGEPLAQDGTAVIGSESISALPHASVDGGPDPGAGTADAPMEPALAIPAGVTPPSIVHAPEDSGDTTEPAFAAMDRDASLRVLLDDLPPTSARLRRDSDGDESEPERHAMRVRRRLWASVAAVFGVALGAQLVWFQREPLVSRWPALRPLYARVCDSLGCTLAPRRAIQAIRIAARDVRDHPRYRDALLVNATLVNEAAFPQPFPVLELQLFDIGGKLLGQRHFQPREYLDASIDLGSGMAVRVPVFVVLEIGGASDTAVSFEFNLL
jgi:predicted Zn finger-like uncharacterized protein